MKGIIVVLHTKIFKNENQKVTPAAKKKDNKVKNKEPEKKKPLKKQDSISVSAESKQKKSSGDNIIQSNWNDIRIAAKQISPETGALLNSCRTVNVRRGRLVLGFSSGILQSKMENGHNISSTKKAIKQICEIDIEIDCEVAGKERVQTPHDLDVDQDGMLGAALSLGGKMKKEEK